MGLDLLVGVLNELLHIGEGSCHDAAEDKVEWLCPHPLFFEIINLKGAVRWDPKEKVSHMRSDIEGKLYNEGWIGLRSTPTTCTSQ